VGCHLTIVLLSNCLIVFSNSLHQFPIVGKPEVDAILTTATSNTPAVKKIPKLPKSAPVLTMPSITVSSGQSVTLLLKLALDKKWPRIFSKQEVLRELLLIHNLRMT